MGRRTYEDVSILSDWGETVRAFVRLATNHQNLGGGGTRRGSGAVYNSFADAGFPNLGDILPHESLLRFTSQNLMKRYEKNLLDEEFSISLIKQQ